jgi:hypothetical protein
MKKLLIFNSLLLLSIVSLAQYHSGNISTKNQKVQAKSFLKQLLLKQEARNTVAAKTTVIRERVIGISDYDTTRIFDSSALKYSNQRGSTFSYDLGFLTGIGPQLSTIGSDIYGYGNSSGILLTHNEAPLALCDTQKQWSIYPFTLIYGYFATENYTYDAANNLLDNFYMGDTTVGVIWLRHISTFNSSGNITTELELISNYTSGILPLDTNYFDAFTYNASGQLVIDSEATYDIMSHTWGPTVKYIYAYDASNNMTLAQAWSWNPGWQLSGTYTMTYYSGTHLLKTYENDTYSPGVLPSYIDSLGYTTGASYITYIKEKNYSTSGLSDISITTRNVNALGLPDTANSYDYSPGGIIYTHQLVITTYNSYRDPVTVTTYFDTTSAIPTAFYSRTYYYYELYNAAKTINISVEDNIRIYPNPATNTVQISYPGFTKNAITTVEILNDRGQKVKREVFPWQNAIEQISVADLTPGLYFVTIQDRDRNVLHTQQVVKL